MIFITGGTGYLGSYVVSRLLSTTDQKLALLTRATDQKAAKQKLWKSLQIHMDQQDFEEFFNKRLVVCTGDITKQDLGMDSDSLSILQENATSVIHCAASLNRKSETKCAQINLMGTLRMIELAKSCKKMSRFSFVSTVAVAGYRFKETVLEDQAVDWNNKEYDPYARTKKFCEEMVTRMLPNISVLIFRPSIVLGDSRFPETTQFDMALAFVNLAKSSVLPFEKNARLDIVPADFVGFGIADIHTKAEPKHRIYQLSSGESSVTYQEISNALSEMDASKKILFAPWLFQPFSATVNGLNWLPRKWKIYQMGALLKVFLPYLHFDTVFSNKHAVDELGYEPAAFTDYLEPFYTFLKKHRCSYPYQELSKDASK